MMGALGVLEEIRPAELFASDAGDPARPGSQKLPLISTLRTKTHRSTGMSFEETLRDAAERDRARARLRVDTCPSSITYAALAQAHASLNEVEDAIAAAQETMRLSLDRQGGPDDFVRDASSARIAAEVLLRFGHGADAYTLLDGTHRSSSLSLTRATVATELGRFNDAFAAIEGHAGPMFEAFRGYLFASQGKYQKAIPHLRAALREVPGDADSALNLSISFWHIGARRKATATALRATRTLPGRKDISFHYMELLLAQGELGRVASELHALHESDIVPDAAFLVIQARLLLAQGKAGQALSVLERALKHAQLEGDLNAVGEIASNRVVIRHNLGRITRDDMATELDRLLAEFPDNDAVVVNYTKTADRRSQASKLRAAVDRISETTTPARRAFLRHYVAFLEGDNDAAGSAALEWFESEPGDPNAAAGALVAIGIGLGRWEEAEKIADFAISHLPPEPNLLNNAAYVLAMVGRADEAIRLLQGAVRIDDGFVLRATFGLAHLASGNLEAGMRLYREAAERAERVSPVWSALMTSYQALVVRELGLDKMSPEVVISALVLAPQVLPDDWADRPDFLRLKFVCDRRGYEWPLAL